MYLASSNLYSFPTVDRGTDRPAYILTSQSVRSRNKKEREKERKRMRLAHTGGRNKSLEEMQISKSLEAVSARKELNFERER